MARPRTVYRGQRRYRWILTVLLGTVLVLLAAGIFVFSFMQRYLVFEGSGLRLEVPFLAEDTAPEEEEEEEAVSAAPAVDAEIVVEPPDFSGVEAAAGEGLTSLRARYLPAEDVAADALSGIAETLSAAGQNAMIVQLTTADGYFHYQSTLKIARDYDLNGSEDITAAMAGLKEGGVYLVAEVSALLATLLAERNGSLALRNTAGELIRSDGQGTWLDPYNPQVREYLSELIQELAGLGFDEVLFSGLMAPTSWDVVYSREMTSPPSITDAVSSLAVFLSQEAQSAGIRCSVLLRTDSLRQGESSFVGQDLNLLIKIFDRMYVRTDIYNAVYDVERLTGRMEGAKANRAVPILSGSLPQTDSWVLVYPS